MASPHGKGTAGRAIHHKQGHHSVLNSESKSHASRSGPQHAEVKYRGARISRARVRTVRDDLDGTRNLVSDLHENFWVTSEQEIREMLAKTEEKIGRAVRMLEKAA